MSSLSMENVNLTHPMSLDDTKLKHFFFLLLPLKHLPVSFQKSVTPPIHWLLFEDQLLITQQPIMKVLSNEHVSIMFDALLFACNWSNVQHFLLQNLLSSILCSSQDLADQYKLFYKMNFWCQLKWRRTPNNWCQIHVSWTLGWFHA